MLERKDEISVLHICNVHITLEKYENVVKEVLRNYHKEKDSFCPLHCRQEHDGGGQRLHGADGAGSKVRVTLNNLLKISQG